MEVDLYSAFIVVPHTHHNVFTKEMEEQQKDINIVITS